MTSFYLYQKQRQGARGGCLMGIGTITKVFVICQSKKMSIPPGRSKIPRYPDRRRTNQDRI